MAQIKLNHGKVALVDDCDLLTLQADQWSALLKKWPTGGRWYAVCRREVGGKWKWRRFEMHRVIMAAPSGIQVDHRNGDGLDNRRENLRLATQQQNSSNRVKQCGDTTSRYKGVHKCDGVSRPWRASIRFQWKLINIGRFSSEEAAAEAYNEKAHELFGEFARLNDVGVVV